MFWGFVLTAAALAIMVIWALIEVFRVDRVIAEIDRRTRQDGSRDDS